MTTPLDGLSEAKIKDAVGLFGYSVFAAWGASKRVDPSGAKVVSKRWTYPYDHRDDGKHKPTGEDLLAHLMGGPPIAVSNITESVVLDADFAPKGETLSDETKLATVEAVSVLLDLYSIPHVAFNSERGVHIWIRLHSGRSLTRPEAAALLRLLAPIGEKLAPGRPKPWEVFPNGGTGVRMPLAVYKGVPSQSMPPKTAEEHLAWLVRPDRATDAQFDALIASAPPEEAPLPAKNEAPGHPEARRPSAGLQEAPSTLPGSVSDLSSLDPEPIRGWKRWPECKRQLWLQGPEPGRRHVSLLTLANEAAESGATDLGGLHEFLMRMPRPNSKTPDDVHEEDAWNAARDALRLKADDDPRRLSGCTHIPQHTGRQETSQLRQSTESFCQEFGHECPILRQWRRDENPEVHRYALQSSIWRGSQGRGKGLGRKAKAVYEFLAKRSGGDPERIIPASSRWVTINLPDDIRQDEVGGVLRALAIHGLIDLLPIDPSGRWRERMFKVQVPIRDEMWVDALAEELQTDRLRQNVIDRIQEEWRLIDQPEAWRDENVA